MVPVLPHFPGDFPPKHNHRPVNTTPYVVYYVYGAGAGPVAQAARLQRTRFATIAVVETAGTHVSFHAESRTDADGRAL